MTLAMEPVAAERTFAWRPGVRLPRDVSAQQLGDEVTAIEIAEGVCTPEALVDRERAQDAPLHRYFTWDDYEAGERFRAMQARALIRSVVVVSEEAGAGRTPAFVHVTVVDAHNGDRRDGYVATARALEATSWREQVLAEALGMLNGLRRRYSDLTELSGLWAALDEVAAAAEPDAQTPTLPRARRGRRA
jgi:hypothetical protein